MDDTITLKKLSSIEEAHLLDSEFAKHFMWYTRGDYYIRCLEENLTGERITLLAYYEKELAGCCHLLYHSKYPFFREENIPEINDLNVFPEYRRKRIASRLFYELEAIASKTSSSIGLGVGLYSDYGKAQIMYGKRGYVMDGRGLVYNNAPVPPGQTVIVDDELLLYLVKQL